MSLYRFRFKYVQMIHVSNKKEDRKKSTTMEPCHSVLVVSSFFHEISKFLFQTIWYDKWKSFKLHSNRSATSSKICRVYTFGFSFHIIIITSTHIRREKKTSSNNKTYFTRIFFVFLSFYSLPV